jgi:hypothetical protein
MLGYCPFQNGHKGKVHSNYWRKEEVTSSYTDWDNREKVWQEDDPAMP